MATNKRGPIVWTPECVKDYDARTPLVNPVEQALAAVNGRATAFTVCDWGTVANLANDAEKRLEALGVPKALRGGTIVRFRPSGPESKAYRFPATSTMVTVTRDTQGKWRLTGVEPSRAYPKAGEFHSMTVSAAARDAILRHAMDGIFVHAEEEAQAA